MGILDKARGLLGQNRDKAKSAVDKAADMIDGRTGQKHSEKIESGAEKAKDAIDRLAGEQSPRSDLAEPARRQVEADDDDQR
jgi:hypothetical protein